MQIALSHMPCQQCGRSDAEWVATIRAGGYSMDDMHQMQMDHRVVGQILHAKESGHKHTSDFAKSQGLEYCQQWDQLRAQDGLLWHHYAQPNENQDWLQLVVPRQLQPQIIEELHQGIGAGHLGQEKPWDS